MSRNVFAAAKLVRSARLARDMGTTLWIYGASSVVREIQLEIIVLR